LLVIDTQGIYFFQIILLYHDGFLSCWL